MFQSPAIDGIFASPTSTGLKRFAWNGYGAPRVPRLYSPSSAPSFTAAISFDPYSSKLRVSAPFSSVPLVDVTFSSPLKNEPVIAAPLPAISNRNGISSWFTTTVASQMPASDCAPAADGVTTPARARSPTNKTAEFTFINLSLHTKSPGGGVPSGLASGSEPWSLRDGLVRRRPVNSGAMASRRHLRQATRARATADTVH